MARTQEDEAQLEMRAMYNRSSLAQSRASSSNASISRSSHSSRSSSSLPDIERGGAQREDYVPLHRPGHRPKRLGQSTGDGVKWVEVMLHIPRVAGLVTWLRGPKPPRRYAVQPIFPKVQSWPQTALSSCCGRRATLVASALMFVIWLVLFSIVLAISISHSGSVPDQQPLRLACDTRLWPNATFCGLDGEQCLPFSSTSFIFICPSGCSSVQVLEPHTIGNQEIIYHNMVIGGPASGDSGLSIYRGDSFICPAAIHAGVISNKFGGCGRLLREGEQRHFRASIHHGISSLTFPSAFPLAFSIASTNEPCQDPQWALLGISALVTSLISLISTSSGLFFTSTFIVVFFQISLASEPPYYSDFPSVLSTAFGRFLPTAFVAWALYRFWVRKTLHSLKASFEQTLFWLGGCWVGALNKYTFDKIPISRLTPHDLQQQPGAITALIIIIALLVAAGIGQVWAFRIEGRLLRYLQLYLLLGVAIGLLATVPGLQLRLHHYILGLLLLPGTSLQTRPSLLYQGILVGLFINGVARWGYASVLQTAAALREDGQLGSALPDVLPPIIDAANISFTIPKLARGFDGFSVLVNDVERYRQPNVSLPAIFSWTRTNFDDPVFFRFGFTGTKPLGGRWYGDYTKPGTWFANETWDKILPGPSK